MRKWFSGALALACASSVLLCLPVSANTKDDVTAAATQYVALSEAGALDQLAQVATDPLVLWRTYLNAVRLASTAEGQGDVYEQAPGASSGAGAAAAAPAADGSPEAQPAVAARPLHEVGYRVVVSGDLKEKASEAIVKVYRTTDSLVTDVKSLELFVDEDTSRWVVSDEQGWLRADGDPAWASTYVATPSAKREPTAAKGQVVMSVLGAIRRGGDVFVEVALLNASKKNYEIYPELEAYLSVMTKADGERDKLAESIHRPSPSSDPTLSGQVKAGAHKEGYLLFRDVDCFYDSVKRSLVVPEMSGASFDIPLVYKWEDGDADGSGE